MCQDTKLVERIVTSKLTFCNLAHRIETERRTGILRSTSVTPV